MRLSKKTPPVTPPEAPKTAPETPVAAPSAVVMVDNQGIGYLRVETTPKGARLILNTGKSVDLIEMDNRTLKSRGVKEMDASVYDAAKILFTPLTESVIVSERAKEHLQKILNNKEIIAMANAKKAAKKSIKAAKSNGSKKSTSTKSGRGRAALSSDAVLNFKKGPTEDSIKRHVDILATLKEDGGGSMTLAEFSKAFGKRVKTKQEPAKIFGMHRKALVDGGFLTVTEPSA